jgi:hypothetical protein
VDAAGLQEQIQALALGTIQVPKEFLDQNPLATHKACDGPYLAYSALTFHYFDPFQQTLKGRHSLKTAAGERFERSIPCGMPP